MDTLTARQQQILDFVSARIDEQGRPPTRAEIASAFGFRSANAAEEHLRALVRKGVLQLDGGSARGISLVSKAARLERSLPLVGQVAAGEPILAAANIEQQLLIDPDFFRPRADFLLRVRGSSMRDAGILDGDLLAVQHTPVVESGQIAVVRIDDEVTVKRYQRQGERVVLLAANPDYPPRWLDQHSGSITIEGRAVGVLRGTLPG